MWFVLGFCGFVLFSWKMSSVLKVCKTLGNNIFGVVIVVVVVVFVVVVGVVVFVVVVGVVVVVVVVVVVLTLTRIIQSVVTGQVPVT